MANQYSVTVSDETDHILTKLRENGYKVSQIVDVAVKTLGMGPLMRLKYMFDKVESE